MPTFEITSPDGKTYEIEAPAGATREQAFQFFKQSKPELFTSKTQPPPSAPTPTGEGMPAGREPDNSAAQWLGVANRALAPYATAAGAGALAGAPFAGVGAPIGAAMGVTALGLGDIGTSLYNVGAGAFGGRRVPLPSETIQNVAGSFGVGRKPETAGQEVLANTLAAATGAGAQAKALNTLAPYVRGPVTQNVVRELGAQPVAQTIAGGGAAAVPSILEQQGVTDPFTLALSSVAGGVAGGKTAETLGRTSQAMTSTAKRQFELATQKPTSTVEELNKAADTAYETADAAGVTFSPQSYDTLVDDVRTNLKREGFEPDLNPKIEKVVGVLEKYKGQALSLTQLKEIRSAISALKGDTEDQVRRRAGDIAARMDKYIEQPAPNAIIAGDEAGIAAFNEGRSMWARMRKSEELETILANVDLKTPDAANTIRSKFATLAANENKMWGFSKDEKAAIRQIGEGKATPASLNIISKIAPGLDPKGLAIGSLLAGSAYYSQGMSPEEAALLGAIGLGARAGRNYLAKRNVSNLAAGIRRGDVQAPYAVQPNALVSPISQQFLNQLAAQSGQ